MAVLGIGVPKWRIREVRYQTDKIIERYGLESSREKVDAIESLMLGPLYEGREDADNTAEAIELRKADVGASRFALIVTFAFVVGPVIADGRGEWLLGTIPLSPFVYLAVRWYASRA